MGGIMIRHVRPTLKANIPPPSVRHQRHSSSSRQQAASRVASENPNLYLCTLYQPPPSAVPKPPPNHLPPPGVAVQACAAQARERARSMLCISQIFMYFLWMRVYVRCVVSSAMFCQCGAYIYAVCARHACEPCVCVWTLESRVCSRGDLCTEGVGGILHRFK